MRFPGNAPRSQAMPALGGLVTERANPASADLDQLSALAIVSAINDEDANIAAAVKAQLGPIADAVERISAAMSAGGRLVYMGCGTSGRLGVLDASECPVTFGVSSERVVGLIAGGTAALTESMEAVEDDPEQPIKDLESIKLTALDVVVGVAASGRTPYVLGGVSAARARGCVTVGVCCNPESELAAIVGVSIAPVVGPEIITGSTRMKAGTATKMVLNMLSTATMVLQKRVYGNYMIHFNATACQKLKNRAFRMVRDITKGSEGEVMTALENSKWETKLAIVMVKKQLLTNSDEARRLLAEHGGDLRKTLDLV